MLPLTLGGVHVVNLDISSPQSFFKDSDKSVEDASLNLPPLNTVLPTKILPFKNVPVVTITACAYIVSSKFVFTPATLPFSIISCVAVACNKSKFFCDIIEFCINVE